MKNSLNFLMKTKLNESKRKKLSVVLLTPIFLLSIVLGVLPSIKVASTATYDETIINNLENSLEQLTIKNAFGEIIYDYSLNANEPVFFYEENYSFALTFRSPSTLFTSDTYKYEIPSGLKITNSDRGEIFADGTGESIGTYQIITGQTSCVEVTFNDAASAAGEFKFGVNFEADFVKENENDAYAYASEDVEEEGVAFKGFSLKAAIPSQTWDLENFVTGVSVRDKNGFPVTNGIFNFDQNYTFSINFAERTGLNGQFSYTNIEGKNVMVYKLPDELKITNPIGWADGQSNGKIKLSNGQPAGDYMIDAYGNIHVLFYNVDNKGEDTYPTNFIDNYTNASFRIDINAQFKEGTQQGEVKFGVNASITINDITPPAAGIIVNKAITKYDSINETIQFAIDVKANGGKIENIKLTDLMTFNIDNNHKVQGNGTPYAYPVEGVEYSVNGGQWIPTSFTNDGTNWNIAFPGVVLKDGESVKLRYTLKLDQIIDYFADNNKITDRLMYDFKLNNTVNATADAPQGETKGSASTEAKISKSFVTKKGVTAGDSKSIEWTAAVGDGSRALNNKTITDTLSSGLKIDGTITVKLYGAPDSSGNFGTPKIISINYNDITEGDIVTDLKRTATGFEYVVPNGYQGIDDIRRVEFIYKTIPVSGDTIPAGQTHTNTIAIKYDDGKDLASATGSASGVTPPGSNSVITKTSEWLYENGSPTKVEYTVQVKVPKGHKGEKIYFGDYIRIGGNGTDNKVILPEGALTNINVEFSPYQEKFTYQIDIFTEEQMRIFFNFGGKNAAGKDERFIDRSKGEADLDAYYISSWPIDQEATITITYTLDIEIAKARIKLDDGTTKEMTLLEIFQKYPSRHLNNQFDAFVPSGYGSKTAWEYYPISKNGDVSKEDPSVFDYTVSLNYNLAGAIFKQGTAIFEDTFDERLEYVPGSFYIAYNQNGTGWTDESVKDWHYIGPYKNLEKQSNNTFKLVSESSDFVDRAVPGVISVDFSSKDFAYLGNYGEFSYTDTWPGCKIGQIFNGRPTIFGFTPLSGSTALPKPEWYYSSYKMFVHYQLRLKEEYRTYGDGKTIVQDNMGNTASVYGTSNKYNDKFSASASVNYVAPKPVTKTMAVDQGIIAKASIEINALGQRLRPENVTSPWFTAKDAMSTTLSYYLNTVKIEYKNSSGEWIEINDANKATAGPAGTAANPRPADAWSVIPVDAQHVNFIIPDETPVRITYDALINADVGEQTTVQNTIEVWGSAVTYDSGTFTVQQTKGEGWANKIPITIFKEDKDTHKRLTGAEFELYKAMGSSDNDGYYGDTVAPTDQSQIITINGKKFYKITDANIKENNGTYTFDSPWIAALQVKNSDGSNTTYSVIDSAYLIVETKAPANYEQVTNTNKESFYTLLVLDNSLISTWQGYLGDAYKDKINTVADNIIITNKSILGDVEIKGVKNVTVTGDTNNVPNINIQFCLTQVNENGTYYTGTDRVVDANGLWENLSIAPKDKSGIEIKFDKIIGLKAGKYYFKVEEVAGDISKGWSYDSTSYIVEVEVTEGSDGKLVATQKIKKTIGGESVDADKIVFNNTFEKPDPRKAQAQIKVTKVIKGTGYDLNTIFHFDLLEVDVNNLAIDGRTGRIAITGAGEGLFTVINLEHGETYYFKITEVNENIPGWKYDATEFIVKIAVDGDGTVSVEYPLDTGGESVVFTNTYSNGGPAFPESGGIGTKIFYGTGIALIIGLAVVLVIRRRMKALEA